jgi:WS/DGAT/MGAT family acyltransferase
MSRPIPVSDLVFLWADRREAPANVGVVLLFQPPPGLSAARALEQVARAYRSTPPTAPFDVVPDSAIPGAARWQTPERIDPRFHVRTETLRPPGTPDQLNARLAELHRDPLDRRRPLFEIHLIGGLASGQFALYVKSHHVTWDGRSALTRIFDSFATTPGRIRQGFHATKPSTAPPADTPQPDPLRALLGQAAAFRELLEALSRRIEALRGQATRARGNAPFAGPPTRFNRTVVPERSLGQFTLPLDELRRVGHAFGGTINDALLAVIDEGIHRYLASLGERPSEALVAMCPVASREAGDTAIGNKATTLFLRMGAPKSSVGRRLREIVASSAAAKSEMRTLSRDAFYDLALLVFGLTLATKAFRLEPYVRPAVNYVVSNVGGVDGERYLGRSRLVAAYPISMVADPVGLNFTTLSHDGRMDVGVVASRAALEDPAPLIAECLAAWERLRRARPPQSLVLRKAPPRKRSRTRRMPAIQRP